MSRLAGIALGRIGLAAGIVLLLNSALFVGMRVVPGDPVRLALGEQVDEAELRRLRAELGLDRPLGEQLVAFFKGAVRGDLGRSLRTGRPVAMEVGRALPVSLLLVAAAVGLGGVLGVGAGWVSASRAGGQIPVGGSGHGGFAHGVSGGEHAAGHFCGTSRWFPSSGYEGPWYLVLPIATLAVAEGAVMARVGRAAIREVLTSDYVRTAVAKGLAPVRVTLKHVMPNAVVPLVGLLVADFGRLVGGAVVVESVFGIPGMGYLVVEAVRYRDYTMLQGAVLVLSGTAVLAGMLGDVGVAVIDPRLR
ncbi:MAG: ABC transporter permease [bacterium]